MLVRVLCGQAPPEARSLLSIALSNHTERDQMADAASRKRDNDIPLEKKLDELYSLIDGIDTAMLTTRRADGSLVARAMATQKRTAGTDLWFMCNWFSEKLDEIAVDPHVNVSYFRDGTRE